MLVHQISLAAKGNTYFTADHHLWPEELPKSLLAFCDELKPGDAWWILGDFFEVWLENHWGMRSDYGNLLELLKKLTDRKVDVKLLVGNRDFVAGKVLRAKTGIQIYEGAWIFESGLGRHMVIHGDELLPSDQSYQRFKRIIRNPFLLNLLKCLPMSLLLKLAGKTRQHSEGKISKISYDKFKMDSQLIQKTCLENEIVKCWAGHLHVAQKQIFSLGQKELEVEVLSQSTEGELHSLVWPQKGPIEFRVWS